MVVVKEILSFLLWTVLPIVLGAAATALGLFAALAGDASVVGPDGAPDAAAANAAGLRTWAIAAAIALGVVLIGKAFRDYRWGMTVKKVRYNTIRDLHNQLGPALQVMTELAMADPAEKEPRRLMLRDIARQCCNALIALTPESSGVRVAVFEVQPDPDRIAPIAHAGRSEQPRTFAASSDEGTEVLGYLNRVPPKPELYQDTAKRAPSHYYGDRERYRSFIRVPIWANGFVFGMLTVDAPKKALSKDDQKLAELIAAELEAAFAITAD